MKDIPDTQLDAFRHIRPLLPRKRQEVFNLIASAPHGMTLFELKEALGWEINSISGRCTELSKGQYPYIEDSGDRRVNPKSGFKARVWRAV